MASNNIYEYMNEKSIDPELICTICDRPLKDPLSTPCDHLFCGECIVEWIVKHNTTCPTCRHQPLATNKLTKANRPLRNMLDRLEVRCTACGQRSLPRGDFDTHLERVCPSANVFCSSADVKCPWQGPRDQLGQHLTSCAFESLRPVLKQFITENQQLREQINQKTTENDEYQHTIRQLISQVNQQMDKNKEYQDEVEQLRLNLTCREMENQEYQIEIQQLTKRIREQRESIPRASTLFFDNGQTGTASSYTGLKQVFDTYTKFGKTESQLKDKDLRIDPKNIQKMMKDAGIIDSKYSTQLLDNDIARVLSKLVSGGTYAKGIKTFDMNGFKHLIDQVADSRKTSADQIIEQINLIGC